VPLDSRRENKSGVVMTAARSIDYQIMYLKNDFCSSPVFFT